MGFDELREPGTQLPNGRALPLLFNFTQAELAIAPHLNASLMPGQASASGGGANISVPTAGATASGEA